MSKTILAIVGMPGAGKTVVTERIMEAKGWPKVYFGQPTFDELAKRGMEVNEKNERAIREELREMHGMAAMAILSLPKIKELLQTAPGVVIESHYSWEEYLTLKENFGGDFKVLAIYASPATRALRLAVRPERSLTKEQVESRDRSQLENLHQGGPIAVADYTIVNEGTLDELRANVDRILAALGR